jgi:uncharacterized SAM-binding protein YcdF (DUF218 family)
MGRWLRRIAWLFLFNLALLLVGYFFRAPLLTKIGQAWVVNDPLPHADAIVVLGGGLENRPFAAAKLYHDGVAPRILYMNVRPSPAEEIGVTSGEAEVTRRILLSNGVPVNAITLIGTNVGTTFDESKAVEAWLQKSGAKTIVIATDLFHTRRARWIFGKEIKEPQVQINIVAVDTRRYLVNNWWQHEEGVMAFETEFFKYAYYRLKY